MGVTKRLYDKELEWDDVPCGMCGYPCVKKKTRKHNKKAAYGFYWYWWCERCRWLKHDEAAKFWKV